MPDNVTMNRITVSAFSCGDNVEQLRQLIAELQETREVLGNPAKVGRGHGPIGAASYPGTMFADFELLSPFTGPDEYGMLEAQAQLLRPTHAFADPPESGDTPFPVGPPDPPSVVTIKSGVDTTHTTGARGTATWREIAEGVWFWAPFSWWTDLGGTATIGCGLTVDEDGVLLVNAGDGLICEGGVLKVRKGCGLIFDDGVLEIEVSDFLGGGLTGAGCVMSVNTGCGLRLREGDLAVEVNPGLGLECEDDKIKVKEGCGITFDGNGALTINTAQLAGQGLSVGTGCTIQVNPGCGITISGVQTAIDRAQLAGDGLTFDDNISACGLKIEAGCGLWLTGISPDRVLEVKYGCGLICSPSGTDGELRVNRDDLIGTGLAPDPATGACAIQVALVEGCGIDVAGATISVDNAALAGHGLTIGTDCYLQVDFDCGLEFDGGAEPAAKKLRVKGTDLAGAGLEASGCVINIGAGCGITVNANDIEVLVDEDAGLTCDPVLGVQVKLSADNDCLIFDALGAIKFDTTAGCGGGAGVTAGCGILNTAGTLSIKNTDIAGPGLGTWDDCGLQINYGCGLEIPVDTLQVKASDLAGDGLTVGSACYLQVETGCGLQLVGVTPNKTLDAKVDATMGMACDPTNGLQVKVDNVCIVFNGSGEISLDPSCQGEGFTEGCGIDITANVISFDATAVAGAGLFVSSGCVLAIGQGCGITVSANEISIDNSVMAGPGLQTWDDCGLEVGAGCGITVNANTVEAKVDGTKGLTCDPTNGIQVKINTTCLTFDGTGAIDFKASCAGTGATYTNGCGINLTGSTFSVKNTDLALNGLITSGTCGLAVGEGCGITVTADAVAVDNIDLAGAGLVPGTGCLLDIGEGCGITVSANAIAVDAADLAGIGLAPRGGGTCFLDIQYSCGLEISANALRVKASDLAGTGLITEGLCGLRVNVGCGLEAFGDFIRVKASEIAGGGLTTESACGGAGTALRVLTGCGLAISGGAVVFSPTAVAGAGLIAGSGCELRVGEGCGITVNADDVAVDRNDLMGWGLMADSGSCNMKIKLDATMGPSCLVLSANGLKVDQSCLSSVLTPGCGLEFDVLGNLQVKNTSLITGAGGLVATGTCALAVNPGCGIIINSGNQVAFNPGAVAGFGLAVGSGCTMNVNVGCGLQLDAITHQVKIKPSDLAGASSGLVTDGTCGIKVNTGCGTEIVANQVRVKASDLVTGAGGLVVAGTCGLAVNPGCGVFINTGNQVAVKTSDLAGLGLAVGTGCTLAVGAGCGIAVAADSISVDAAAIAGNGLTGTGCTLNVVGGCGINVAADSISVKNTDLVSAASGLVVSGPCGIAINVGCGIQINSGNQLVVDTNALAGNGLVVGAGCQLNVGPGCGITVGANAIAIDRTALVGQGIEAGPGTCNLKVKLSTENNCLLFDSSGAVKFDTACATGSMVTPGCGLQFSGGSLVVKAGDLAGPGLITNGTCGLAVNVGCGFQIVSDAVTIDNAALAGNGLTAGAGCAVNVGAGCGINVGADSISVKNTDLVTGAGGLVVSGACAISVNVGCGIQINTGNQLVVDTNALAGNGLVVGAGCQLNVGPGCGITVGANAIAVNATHLIGNSATSGLVSDTSVQTCGIKVDTAVASTVTEDYLSDCTAFGKVGNDLQITFARRRMTVHKNAAGMVVNVTFAASPLGDDTTCKFPLTVCP